MNSLVQRQGAIDTHEPSIALINEALSVFLCLERLVLKEEIVDFLNNFIGVGVSAGGQDSRAKVLGNLRVFWCWRWRRRAAVGLWRGRVSMNGDSFGTPLGHGESVNDLESNGNCDRALVQNLETMDSEIWR
jgi:hypothetical protein